MGPRQELLPPGPLPSFTNAAGAPDPFSQDERTGWIVEALRVLRERRRIILGVIFLAAVPLLAYSLFVPAERSFEAKAQVLVEPDVPHPLEGGLAQPSGPEDSYYETQYRILRSRSLARRTLVSLAHPAAAAAAEASDAKTDTVAAAAAVDAAIEAVPASAVDAFLRGLTIAHIPDSRLVEIRFRSADPAYAARAVNAHTQAYVRQSVELTMLASRHATRWLGHEIDEGKARVETGEAALEQYRKQEGMLEERQAMVSQRMSELNGAVLRARAQRVAKETAYQQIDAARQAGRPLRDLAAMVPTAIVQQLSIDLAALQRKDVELAASYGERFPERVKTREAIQFTEGRLDAEVTRAIDVLRADVAAAHAEESKMAGSLQAQTAESSALGRKAVDYQALKRDVGNDRALFERLQQRARELRLSGDYELSNVRVIDPAEVPRTPLPDTKWRDVGMAAAASMVLAFLLAFGIHFMDERLRSPEDITTHLGLPYLGMVPKLARDSNESSIVTSTEIPSPFTEAMRDLRTHVLCTPAGRASRILLVASAGMNEGKSLVATNLAAGLARVGHRVLLIDLDLRKPSLHTMFGVPLQPGLSDLLSNGSNGAGRAEAIRTTDVRDLWVLPAGRARANPGDLIGSAGFRRLIQSLPESFDRIVLDSPPVMAVTDTSLIAHEQVGVIFVVSADRTGRRAAQAALERLDAVGARFVGAVLNRVDLRRDGSAFYLQYDESYGAYDYEEAPRPPQHETDARAVERHP
jgi:capsular exopolysaccharide synthesis family protein